MLERNQVGADGVAAALGLGLGLRPLLGSVIAGRHVDNMLEVGSIVTFGDVTGEVVGVGHVCARYAGRAMRSTPSLATMVTGAIRPTGVCTPAARISPSVSAASR